MADTIEILAQAMEDLKQANDALDRAREQQARAEMEVAELGVFVQRLQKYAVEIDEGSSGIVSREHGGNGRVSLRIGTAGRALVDGCIQAIREADHPMPIGSLLEWCLSHGLTVGGADQKSNLAGYLSRDPRLKSLGRSVGWTLVETERATDEPGSQEAAPSTDEGGTDDRSTLAPSGHDDLLG